MFDLSWSTSHVESFTLVPKHEGTGSDYGVKCPFMESFIVRSS